MKFKYDGPFSGVTLASGEELLLHPQAVVDLPEEHEYVQTLIALGHLKSLRDFKGSTPPSPPAGEGSGERGGVPPQKREAILKKGA